MPFTPTHILAALPFWPARKYLPLEAIAIGAMVPDAPLFYPFLHYAQTHSAMGAFTICLPLGVSLFLLFDLVGRRPFLSLLPTWFQRRITGVSKLPSEPRASVQISFFTGVLFATILGVFSHQAWDAFTHEGRWGTQLLPFLNSEYSIGSLSIPGYKLLQYGSTIIGLPLLVLILVSWVKRINPSGDSTNSLPTGWKISAWCLMLFVTIAVGIYAISTAGNVYQIAGMTIKLSGAIFGVMCLVYCLGFYAFHNLDSD